jgi:hypothetical protein
VRERKEGRKKEVVIERGSERERGGARERK